MKTLAKSKKLAFCKGVSPWFLSKNWPFSYRFFLSKNARKKHFLIFWIENKVFWTSKVKFSQSRKKSTFCKAVSPWSSLKIWPFSYMFFFFSKESQKKTVFYILECKEYFLHLKSEVLKNSKKWTFCKGVSPWFLSKNRPFPHIFFFRAKRAREKQFFIFWTKS